MIWYLIRFDNVWVNICHRRIINYQFNFNKLSCKSSFLIAKKQVIEKKGVGRGGGGGERSSRLHLNLPLGPKYEEVWPH